MQVIFYIFSSIFFINSIFLAHRGSFTIVMYLGLVVFGVLAHFYEFLAEITQSGLGWALKFFFFAGLAFYMFMICFVLAYARSTVNYQEKAIIVLGCGLNEDGSPGETLQNRLDACINYANKNPNATIVVSGGYSKRGYDTEGSAMKDYLVSHGISEEMIICENKASNTAENFSLSKQLLEERDIKIENIAFVTNSFHVYRALKYAEKAGFTNIKSLSCKTDVIMFLPSVLREVIGVLAMDILDY